MGCSGIISKNNPHTENTNNISLTLDMNNEIIDKILSLAPERTKTSLEELTHFFKSQSKLNSLTNQNIIKLVYKWISNNITFDCEDYLDKLKNKDDMNYLSQEEIFSEGETTSHGYVTLFITILSDIDEKIETKIIKGYVKNFLYKYGIEFEAPNHEWIMVNINNRWYLVDPTFGAGYCTYTHKKLVFTHYYNNFYCFTPPELFIKTHFPEEEKYQLNSKKINIDMFYKLPIYKTNFFNFGFKSAQPEEGTLNIEKEGKIIINLQKDIDINNLFLSAKMSYKDNNVTKTVENSILIEKKENGFEIMFFVNRNFIYKLTIFGINSLNDKDDFKELLVYKIIKKNNEENKEEKDKEKKEEENKNEKKNENKEGNNEGKKEEQNKHENKEDNKEDNKDENKKKSKKEKKKDNKKEKDKEKKKDNKKEKNKDKSKKEKKDKKKEESKDEKKDENKNENKDENIDNNIFEEGNYFPTVFDKFSLSDIILIEPRNYYLIKGEKINFKIKTNMYKNNLFFILEDDNGDHMIELEKKENNIFEENSIYIHGNKAHLIYLNENNYMDYLLDYKLINKPNNKTKISYPKIYKSIKNKLIEPLCDSLKKGDNVNFKIEIKNDNVKEVFIIEGENFTKLNQENNLFFGEVKINGIKDKIIIAYKEKQGEDIKIMYSYKIL